MEGSENWRSTPDNLEERSVPVSVRTEMSTDFGGELNLRHLQCRRSITCSPKKIHKGNKTTHPWKTGDVVTVANAVPQPSGHDPERGSAPPSRMDADHCNDAPF